jgi:hypothetical protein
MVSLSDIKDRARQAVSSDSTDSDASRIDQADARVERARQEAREEARREAQREQVEQRVEEAREQAREEGRAAVDGVDTDAGADATEGKGALERVTDIIDSAAQQVADADGLAADDIDAAMGVDFDNDGEPLAGELGLQTNDRAAVENDAFGTLGERVRTNEQNITTLESEVFGSTQQSASRRDPMSPGGGAAFAGGAAFGGTAGVPAENPGGGFSGGLVELDEGAANGSVVETADVPGLEEMGFDPDEGL